MTILTVRTVRLHIDYDRRCYATKTNDQSYETTLELDSHADTCVLGRHALIILDHNRPVTVMGYDESLGSKTYKTVSGGCLHRPHNREDAPLDHQPSNPRPTP